MSIPTLLLTGGESPLFLKASVEAVNAALPNSRIAVIPGQGHIAMSTAPELFLRGNRLPGRVSMVDETNRR